MARHSSGIHVRKRSGSPFWQAAFRFGGKEVLRPTGIRWREHPLPSSAIGEAAQVAAAFIAERRAALPASIVAQLAGSLTLSTLGPQFVKHLRETRGEQYAGRAATNLDHYVLPRWSYPREITAEAWRALTWDPETRTAGELHTKPTKRRSRLSWSSIANLAQTLRDFLKFCSDQGAIEAVPEIASPPTKLRKADRAYRRAFEEEEWDRFLWTLATMGEARALRIYITLRETWVRKSTLEALTLRWCDFRAGLLRVPADAVKGGEALELDLTPAAAEAIKAEANARGVVELDAPVFGTFDFHRDMRDWWAGNEGGVFGRACKLAGIDRRGLVAHHATRTTALTAAGQDPQGTLSGLMYQAGIKTPSVVEHYLKPNLRAARRVTRRQFADNRGSGDT